MTSEILTAIEVTKNFEGLIALNKVSLSVERNSIVSLIGPNGAGKTTFFNCLTGIYKPNSGSILFHDNSINLTDLAPHNITRQGVARTFQNIRLFANMTVLENVMCGAYPQIHTGLMDIMLKNRRFKQEEAKIVKESIELLKFVDLSDKLYNIASSLPYGEQRKLEIARALASRPILLLLDEPAAGMNAVETDSLMILIKKIRDSGVSILLIEHDMRVVMNISDRVCVLNYGEKIAEDTPEKIRADKHVIEAYLGEVTV